MDAPQGSIRRLLVANRGEIARRVFATCRRLGIATVAVYADPDAAAPHVREADVAVALGGATPAESYLRGDAIVAAALASGADAIHPGYGFLSEDSGFARAVGDAGLTWVGPSSDVIAAMGSKLRARETMAAAGVPVLPGGHAVAGDDAALDELAAAIGFPLLVKASAGGGGRGMRRVEEAAALAEAVEFASREALVAFGDGQVFLERLVVNPRHVEVQILGDEHGSIAVLPERDCSLQRRHQKVVEESPAPRLDDAIRAALADAARRAAGALGYTSAGTVEFVLTPAGEVFFLEVNTRLQVEHPVTELISALDLVELQLRVAEGEPLPPEALDPVVRGHAIEARLVAEDPAAGWLPQTGTVEAFSFDGGVRVDTGVEAGSEITPYYDSLLAKVIVHGATREAATRRLVDVLRRARLACPTTNRDLLVRLLDDPVFAAGEHHTQYLDGLDLGELGRPLLDAGAERLAAAAAALAGQAARRASARSLAGIPSGWRNVGAEPQSIAFRGTGGEIEVRYAFDRAERLASLEVRGPLDDGVAGGAPAAGGQALDARLWSCSTDAIDLEVGGLRERYAVYAGHAGTWVFTSRGQVLLHELPRFACGQAEGSAGSLAAPLPGAVIRVLVSEGDAVEASQPMLVLEAMKMEHEIVAPAAGIVRELAVAVGDHVEAGQTLTVVSSEE